ncbi:MAG: hypothetical protein K2X81_19865 [Candidatus Obscuribacterales bacterium]|nr:hypothetical protein [Candidatus Obscuribacterales bacterium]
MSKRILLAPKLFGFAICLSLMAGSLSLITPAFAQEQPSLIESALDSKSDIPVSLPAATPVVKSVAASKSAVQKKASKISVAKKKAPNSTVSLVAAPAINSNAASPNTSSAASRPVVVSVPAKAPADSEDIPPPSAEILAPPIHSTIPATQRDILGLVPLGTKIGKSYALDQAYRGKPALPTIPTVTFGTPSWAIPDKKKVAATPALTATPANQTPTPVQPLATPNANAGSNAAAAEKPAEPLSILNVRFQMNSQRLSRATDVVWAYPYPPKMPKQVVSNPLPEEEAPLKNLLLQTGYNTRPDASRPYPNGGWRWIHAFETARAKAGLGFPHTMLTMYPWVDKMFPYARAECHELNLIEEARSKKYQQLVSDYERIHVDIESLAATRGLVPIEMKISPRGVGQLRLPAGNWWLTATRAIPGLKAYWQIPVSCTDSSQTINVQLNENNALIIGGGW